MSDGTDLYVAFVDSSALVALADSGDATHRAAVSAYEELRAAEYRLFTTSYAIAEAFELIAISLGNAAARQWLQALHIDIYHLDPDDISRARNRLVTDERLASRTLTDALNITAMERLGVRDAFAVDPDFVVELD
ncbi:MAG: type II toxin-antitoxin system VapC family toxin [Thermomicrobiales bacterium]